MKHTTYILLLSSFILTACAGIPNKPTVVEINKPAVPAPTPTTVITPAPSLYLDEDCSRLSKFARSIAAMRDAGVAIDDVHLLINSVPPFEINPVIREVYSRKDISPDSGAINSYKVCINVGYENMVSALSKAEEDNKRVEQEKIRAALAARSNQNSNAAANTRTRQPNRPRSSETKPSSSRPAVQPSSTNQR